MLSSILHATIATQKRINKSDDNIESVIKKEMQVILYHIQILKQDLNESMIKAEVQYCKHANDFLCIKEQCAIVCSRSYYTSYRHFNRFISSIYSFSIKCTISSAPLQRHVIFINYYYYYGREKRRKKRDR